MWPRSEKDSNFGYYNAERDTKRRVSRLRQVSAVYDYGFFPCMCARARARARASASQPASQPAEMVGAPRVFALRGYAYEFFSKRRWRRRCMRAAENSSSRLVSSRLVSCESVRACVRTLSLCRSGRCMRFALFAPLPTRTESRSPIFPFFYSIFVLLFLFKTIMRMYALNETLLNISANNRP